MPAVFSVIEPAMFKVEEPWLRSTTPEDTLPVLYTRLPPIVSVELLTITLAILLPWLVPLPTVMFPVTETEPLLMVSVFVPEDEGLLILTLPLTVNTAFVTDNEEVDACEKLSDVQILLLFMVQLAPDAIINPGKFVAAVPEIDFKFPLNVTDPEFPLKEPPLLTQFPYTSRLYPFAMVIKPARVMLRHLALLAPIVGENNTCEDGGMLILVADVGTPPHQFPAANQFALIAPVQLPALPQLITRVEMAVAPGQLPVPVTVNVATKDPAETEGMNMARAGSVCCCHIPNPVPPDQVFPDPEAVAPVIVIGTVPLQLLIAVPAYACDKPVTVTVTDIQAELLQEVPQRA